MTGKLASLIHRHAGFFEQQASNGSLPDLTEFSRGHPGFGLRRRQAFRS
jgi:hypothetical protein